MPIYKQTTEITNIDDLLSSVERDIEEVYFGDKNVFTVWAEYDGTLPATINANGADMRQYRLYGSTGGVGDRTVNLFDKNNQTANKYVTYTGELGNSGNHNASDYIEINPSTNYTLSNAEVVSATLAIYNAFYDSNKTFISSFKNTEDPTTIMSPINAKYVRLTIKKTLNNIIMLTEGSTAPASFVPYGYEVDMVSRTRNLFDMSFYKGISGITVSGNKITGTCDRFFNVRLSIPAELYGQELTWSVYIKRPDNPGTVRVQTVDRGIYKYGNDITGEGRSTVRFTATSTIRLYINYSGTGTDTIELSDIMLNVGSIALPYEPYSNTTTPIYIGDEPLEADEYVDYQKQKVVRAIKKLVLTGEEGWYYRAGNPPNVFFFELVGVNCVNNCGRCTRYPNQESGSFSTLEDKHLLVRLAVDGTKTYVAIRDSSFSYVENFISYLEQQYAAGTPVIVWCALITAEEADPPVPLPALPTCEGTTVIDYAGQSAAPEKAILKYRKKNF